jgi:hypothetical protein
MLISIIVITSRPAYCLESLPDKDWLPVFFDSIEQQDFSTKGGVEVLIVDGLYEDRHFLFTDSHTYDGKVYSFKIKHIDQVKGNPFFVRGLWGEAFSINRGIINADGELLMTCNDTCELTSKDLLKKAWNYYKPHNKFLLPRVEMLVPEIRSGRSCLHDKDEDHRFKFLEKQGGVSMEAPGAWFHGFSFYSMEAALKVNGYNVALDGLYGSIDCDMGLRLETAGYQFIFDGQILIHRFSVFNDLPHKPRMLEDVPLTQGSWKPNGGMMWYNRNRGIYRVNDIFWSSEMIAQAWEDLKQVFVASGVLHTMTERVPVEGSLDWKLLQWWYAHQIVYDLAGLREERIKNENIHLHRNGA